MKLSNSEEQLMEYLWQKEKATMKELLNSYQEPKPALTTIATLLKRMIDKNFVSFNSISNTREYFPTIKKNDYFTNHIDNLIDTFFNKSASQFASFFTKETNLTKNELLELKKIIDNQINEKND